MWRETGRRSIDTPNPQPEGGDRVSAATADASFNLTDEARRYLETTAGQRFKDDGEAVGWAIKTLGGALSSEAKRRQSQTGHRISGEQYAKFMRALGRTEPFKDAAELLSALDEQRDAFNASKERLDRAQMQEVGRALAREREQRGGGDVREVGEDPEHDDADFHRRFGERVKFSSRPPADADEAERRSIARHLGIDHARVI